MTKSGNNIKDKHHAMESKSRMHGAYFIYIINELLFLRNNAFDILTQYSNTLSILTTLWYY